jgi:hypothetical protein
VSSPRPRFPIWRRLIGPSYTFHTRSDRARVKRFLSRESRVVRPAQGGRPPTTFLRHFRPLFAPTVSCRPRPSAGRHGQRPDPLEHRSRPATRQMTLGHRRPESGGSSRPRRSLPVRGTRRCASLSAPGNRLVDHARMVGNLGLVVEHELDRLRSRIRLKDHLEEL